MLDRIPLWNRMPIAMKIAGLSAATTIAAVVGVALTSRSMVHSALVQRERAALSTLVSERAAQASAYFQAIRGQAVTLAASGDAAEALRALSAAFESAPAELAAQGLDPIALTRDASSYFIAEFRPRLTEAGLPFRGADAYLPASPSGRALQGLYIARNPSPVGQKLTLDRDPTPIGYNDAHAVAHPRMRRFLETFGYYDIFLVDTHGNIVYSVFKETDYATNLETGPYSTSNLARVAREAASMPAGGVALADFEAYEPSYGAPAAFIATPVFDGGTRLGVLAFQMPIGRINDIFNNPIGLGETGESYIVGADGRLRSQARLTDKPTILTRAATPTVAAAMEGRTAGTEHAPGLHGPDAFIAFEPLDIDGVRWAIVGERGEAEILAPLAGIDRVMAAVGLGIAALSILPALLLGEAIRRPLMAVVVRARDLSKSGKLGARMPAKRRDELGDLSRAINGVLETITGVVREVAAAASAVSESSGRMTGQVNETNRTVASQKRDTSSVAAALEELAASIASIESQCREAASNADAAGSEAAQGSEVILEAMEQIRAIADTVRHSAAEVQGLGDRSARIGQVISVIDDIAEQTNLLALNAAIEAARAGEHGRGFAVVADEVRKLAERTTTATKEIAATIKAMQGEVSQAVQTIESGAATVDATVENAARAGQTMNAITQGSERIAAAVASIAAAVTQQAPAAAHASEAVQRLDEAFALLTEHTSSASDLTSSVASQAGDLLTLTRRFDLK